MSIEVMGIQSICVSRGGVGANVSFDPARIEGNVQTQITNLNDLAILLGVQDATAEGPLSEPTAFQISDALSSAQGATSFERYLNALASVCGADGQCSGLPEEDKPKALVLQSLRQLSQTTFSRLVVLVEAQQSNNPIQKILMGVSNLISEMAAKPELTLNQLNVQTIYAQIAIRCEAGKVPITAPPPPVYACSDGIDNDNDEKIDYPNDPGCTDANDIEENSWNEHRLVYGAGFMPAYRLLAYGNGDSALGSGPSLHLSATFGGDISEKVTLQGDLRGFVNVTNEFTSSRLSQDFASLIVTYDPFVFQGSFLFERRNILTGDNEWLVATEDEYLAALGFGARISDWYPFGGVLVGTSDGSTWGGGFYSGIRFVHEWEQKNVELSWQAFYSLLYQDKTYDHQAGLSAEAAWSPTSFWGATFNLEAALAGGTMVR